MIVKKILYNGLVANESLQMDGLSAFFYFIMSVWNDVKT
jgi:hypothetical protein